MKVHAKAKYIRISPRKTRLVVDLIRGLSIEEARGQLKFSLKAAAKPILKTLNSAIANAEHNNKVKLADLSIAEAYVDEGPTFHRFKPRAQGRATKIRKRMSHITIVLTDGMDEDVSIKSKVESEKPVVKKATTKKTAKAKKEATT
jgi:large subunit ribosomal protein L22